MRIVSRTTRSLLEQKRERSLRNKVAAGTLSKAYPDVERVRIQLRFIPTAGSVPAAQIHALYPSAPAYFEFACPYGDCDGSFDLNAIASTLLGKSGAQVSGSLNCPGTRTGSALTRQPCNLRADYWFSAQYQAIERAAG